MPKPITVPFPYPGNRSVVRSAIILKILELITELKLKDPLYVECFACAGTDINGNIINLFIIIRDRKHEFLKYIRRLAYYYNNLKSLKEKKRIL